MMLKVLSSLWLKGSNNATEYMLQVGQIVKDDDVLYKRILKEVHKSRIITAEDYRKGKRGALVACDSLKDLESEPDPRHKDVEVGKGDLVVLNIGEPMVVDGLSLSELKGKDAVVASGKVQELKSPEPVEAPAEVLDAPESAAQPLQEVLSEDVTPTPDEASEKQGEPVEELEAPKKPGRKKAS